MKSRHLSLVKTAKRRTVGRKANAAYRVREHLTEGEMAKLLTALKANRHGHRDWLIGLLVYRHGLRVSEACDLRWDDLDLPKRTIAVRRLKGSVDSSHYLERDELAGLKRLQREQEPKSSFVFATERGTPFGRMGIARMIERAGKAAKLAVKPHVHMLRHSTRSCLGWQRDGYKAVAALPRPCLNHQYSALHCHVTGTIQGHMALGLRAHGRDRVKIARIKPRLNQSQGRNIAGMCFLEVEDRAELEKLLKRLDTGDVLIVTRLDRLARSTRDLLNILDRIGKAGASFRSLADTWADTSTAHGKLMITILGGLAEFERSLILARTSEGRRRAKERGVHMGRPSKLTHHQRREAMARREAGETCSDIARSFAVSHSIISRL